jgi:DNA-binding transcriptional MerR regulator
MPESEDYLPIPKIAKMFGVKGHTVRLWIRNGLFPATKINDRWYARYSDLQVFAKEKHG